MTTGLSYDGSTAGTDSYIQQLANLAVVKLGAPQAMATFTGVATGGTAMTVSSVNGTIAIGQLITGSGVPSNTYIVSGSGSSWVINNNATFNSTVVSSEPDPFTILIPQAITYAENRIYRDLDFLSTVSVNATYSTTFANRKVTIPADAFVTIQDINVITPAGTPSPDTGTRNQLLPTTKEFLNATYPNSQSLALPSYFAMLDQNSIILGPVPDNIYTIEIIGTIRPNSLSSTNQTTFISLYLPDLFLMASMIFVSGYQRNFGRQSDDPAMAQSYEAQYKTLLAGAMVEEARKKFQSSAWSSMSLPVVATPSR